MQQQLLWTLTVLGIVMSTYLVKDHYDTERSICDFSGSPTFSCAVVNKSAYSLLFRVPVAFFGVAWYTVLAVMNYQLLEGENTPAWVLAHFLWSVVGMVFVFYFVAAEYLLGAICPFCTVVHILGVAVMWVSWKIKKVHGVYLSLHTVLETARTLRAYVIPFALLFLVPIFYFNLPEPVRNLSSLTTCLQKADVVMYTSADCAFCQRQLTLLGPDAKAIRMVDCALDPEECVSAGVTDTPTWARRKRSGKEWEMVAKHVGMLTVRELAAFGGCEEPPQ